ncbi:M24 family metallopeptidase C-terminal domain-containing protein, partial [Acinetobacter baumannii]|uniref:M24 family metallopeptidase C-terminal domain-containing protein n=1 Tax=Acinetobacter baumannii TaxID=470 RepID=UPI001490065E
GYYKTGSHGIRIENLLVVREAATDGFLEFETITFCPIDRRAIDVALLDPVERAWIDAYHARVAKALARRLEGRALAWL